ncbi:MAG: ABC transporter ATP-binding protein [Planctomycetota bacterium]|nr:ABC transporter ATP-binding protein [Planctomycetota bacterium]MDP6519510.1 ABC transporter ATP-binding protein [Planctomycetota bacterium]MDP6955405.1 ABC transporter ATP-binding protein [Planctomycetota bacterium]
MATPSAPPLAIETTSLGRHHLTHLGLRRHQALDGVSLQVPAGSVLGLVGPNGSGKSTLLRLLAGVDQPKSGGLSVLGGSPNSAAIRRRIGYLPENNPFPAELSARAALTLMGALDGLGRERLRTDGPRLLEEVGLSAAASLPLGRFSRGMGRRFGLAQAWLGEPDLLLLDEATAGLDAEGFAVLERLLARAQARGATVVMASHLLSDILEHCDRVAVLVAGRLVATGQTAEILGTAGRRRLDVTGLCERDLADLDNWLAERGGRLVGQGPAGRPLVDLFQAAPGPTGKR